MPTSAPKGLSRIDQPGKHLHTWLVRVMRGGVLHREYFSDLEHGGSREASEAAARARYAELVATLPGKTPSKNRMTKRNKSGKVGVHLATGKGRPGSDCVYTFWVAAYAAPDGKIKHASFAINKFGNDLAHRLASIARDLETNDRHRIYDEYERLTGERIKDNLL